MAIVTGDQYLESLVKFVETQAEKLIEGTSVLKLNPVGLRYVQSRLEALAELESLLAGAPVDYLRAYVSDLGDHRALEQLRRILRLIPSLKLVSVLPSPARDPTPLFLLPFGKLKVLELRGCDLSSSQAKGLLELSFTLEKLICHNSTDALRHVFVSRIAEIKDSPQWNRLSFVSCALNGLVLMDESLQLLPVVETLDLSRNKFAKVDNLRKCIKLKHLDLGFNSLRNIASLSQVSCQIVKLVLRNNALTTLHGIEKLKSLEGLDVSYNIISNFSELEILAGLPSLQNLWLDGNPLCCARWFRAQVFSFFSNPEEVTLDDERISASEFWKRQVIVASRQKQPASFGFYSPVKDDADLEGMMNRKKKRILRLVSIETEEQNARTNSDQDSITCDNELQSKEENCVTGEEAEVEDLMKRIESMKRERSAQWLREFKEWMEQTSEDVAGCSKHRNSILNNSKDIQSASGKHYEDLGESSRYISDSVQHSGDESSTIMLESETSFADTSTVISAHRHFDQITEAASNFSWGHTGGFRSVVKNLIVPEEEPRFLNSEGHVCPDTQGTEYTSCALFTGHNPNTKNAISPSSMIRNITGSHTSLACPGSPPHYQEDILHRRQDLEEEFLQLSVESLSVASTESSTSCGEDDSAECGPYTNLIDQALIDNLCGKSTNSFLPASSQENTANIYDEGSLCTTESRKYEVSSHTGRDSFIDALQNCEFSDGLNGETDRLENKRYRRKPRRRMICLPEEEVHCDTDSTQKTSDNLQNTSHVEYQGNGICCPSGLWESITADENENIERHNTHCSGSNSNIKSSIDGKDGIIETSLNLNVADSGVNEKYNMQCNCHAQHKSDYNEK